MLYFKQSPLFITGLQKILTSVWPCAGRTLHCRDGYKGWHHAARKVPGEGTAGHCGGYRARLCQPGDVPIVIKKEFFFFLRNMWFYTCMVFGRKEMYTQSVWRLERKSSYQSMVELKLFLMTRCRWLFLKIKLTYFKSLLYPVVITTFVFCRTISCFVMGISLANMSNKDFSFVLQSSREKVSVKFNMLFLFSCSYIVNNPHRILLK